jgi:hypothetical protein
MSRFTYKDGKPLGTTSGKALKASMEADAKMGRVERADAGQPSAKVIIKTPTVRAFVQSRQKKKTMAPGG